MPSEYKFISSRGFPANICSGNPQISNHRAVAYKKYGDSLPPCEICGSSLGWQSCVIDHIDFDKTNDDPTNLRPLCPGCNTSRNKENKNTFSALYKKMGFARSADVTRYCRYDCQRLKRMFDKKDQSVPDILLSGLEAMRADPAANKNNGKAKRFADSMHSAGYVRVFGWATPENKEKITALMSKKTQLDYGRGEHLIKTGQKLAKKGCN